MEPEIKTGITAEKMPPGVLVLEILYLKHSNRSTSINRARAMMLIRKRTNEVPYVFSVTDDLTLLNKGKKNRGS